MIAVHARGQTSGMSGNHAENRRSVMARVRKHREVKSTIADAVSYAYSELEELGNEVREVVDNASGTNRENTGRIQTLGETADTLESISDPTIDEELGKVEVTYHEMLPRSRRHGLSRGDRRDNATGALDAVIQVLEEMEEVQSAFKGADQNKDETDYRGLIEDLERMKDEAESAEFPGMYG